LPDLYIIAGCNGAGKTTASFTILPEILNCKEFVNADEIARGLSPFQPESVSFQASRIMIERINELLSTGESFAFETTLTTISYLKTIELAKHQGYTVRLFFFWLNDSTLAIKRVKKRVNEGGHNIPEDVIERRYHRGIHNLLNRFIPVCDTWLVIDNSEEPHKFVADGLLNSVTHIYEPETWQNIKDQTHE
jgi:predicted ABC-type ATPase